MNIHHLELFYFVVKHGGIAGAVRNIPYGIQQPAVSGQIARIEESLGTKLFQRRPFALSPAGRELFEFIRPFFENIDVVAERLRQNSSPQLRIVAPAIVLKITCRKSYNVFEQNFPPSDFIYTRQLGLRPSNCFWLAKSILRLC